MKRFWESVSVQPDGDGWSVLLDTRPVRTPARKAVVVPIKRMAAGIAAEWDAQTEMVSPLSMPLTRAAVTCLDRVAPEFEAIAAELTRYGATDLLCYRAETPPGLVERQSTAWDPVLDWARVDLGAALTVTGGILPVDQPVETVERLGRIVRDRSAWALTGLAELVTLSGSLVLALAVDRGEVPAELAWDHARIDEQWNIDQWGEDADAAALAAQKRAAFLDAAAFLEMLRQG